MGKGKPKEKHGKGVESKDGGPCMCTLSEKACIKLRTQKPIETLANCNCKKFLS